MLFEAGVAVLVEEGVSLVHILEVIADRDHHTPSESLVLHGGSVSRLIVVHFHRSR